VFFIYAILGVFLFNEVGYGKITSEYSNFNNFGQAMLMLLRIATGEEWHLIMCDYTKDSVGMEIYFLSFVAISNFVILNLFIMVILQ
jgi:hypothetical protein